MFRSATGCLKIVIKVFKEIYFARAFISETKLTSKYFYPRECLKIFGCFCLSVKEEHLRHILEELMQLSLSSMKYNKSVTLYPQHLFVQIPSRPKKGSLFFHPYISKEEHFEKS